MASLTKTVTRGVFWASSGTFFIKVVTFATLFLVLRYFSVYEYGLMKLAMSAIGILGIFSLPGLSSVVVTDMANAKGRGELGETKKILWDYFKLQIILGFVAWAVVFFGSDLIALYYKGQISLLLKILSFSFLVAPFRTLLGNIFSVYFKFFTRSLHSFLEEVFKLIIIIVAVFWIGLGVEGVIVASVMSQVLSILVLTPFFLRVYAPIAQSPIQEGGPFWNLLYFHGKWSIFSNYLSSFGQHIRIFIIRFFLGTEAVGLFSAATGILSHTTALIPIGGVVNSVIPQFIKDKKRFVRIVTKSMKYQFIGYAALGIFAFFAFPPVITLVFPKYQSAIILYKILLLALIPASFASIINTVFFSFKAQKDLFFSIVLKTILIVVLTPVMVYYFGIIGVAIEYILTFMFFVLERYHRIRKKYPFLSIRPSVFWSIDDDDRVIINKISSYFRRKLSFLGVSK